MTDGALPDVARIERESFARPMGLREMARWLAGPCCCGEVLQNVYGNIVGYSMYEFSAKTVTLVSLAVDRRYRGEGLGWHLLASVIRKVLDGRQDRVIIRVRETYLGAQQFLKSQGIPAVGVAREAFADTGEDAFIFEFPDPRPEGRRA
jgi:ribosomal protein S18 acetylase RimI-like enzyme